MDSPNWLLNNSAGKPSWSFTSAVVSFCVVTVLLFTSTISSIGSVTFRPVDTTFALGYLAATFSAYVVRKNAEEIRDDPKHIPPSPPQP